LLLNKFRTSLNSSRAQVIHRLRGMAAKIFGLPATYFEPTHPRGTVEELAVLLKFNAQSNKYPKFAPILFPDLKEDMRCVFKNPVLPKVIYSHHILILLYAN